MSTNQNKTIMNDQKKTQLSEYAAQLNQLQAKIQSSDALSVKHGKVSFELAVKAGGILNIAKDLIPYGEWEAWLKANVKGITDRTAQNYMKLAKRVSVLGDCQSLGEAYRAIGIKRKSPVANEQDDKGEKETPPTEGQKSTEDYQSELNEAAATIASRVRNELDNAKVEWRVGTWTIKGDKPASDDTTNNLALVIHELTHLIAFRNHTNLKAEDEVRTKAKVVLTELLNQIIRANRPLQPEVAESVSDYAFEVNPQPVEAVEQIAA